MICRNLEINRNKRFFVKIIMKINEQKKTCDFFLYSKNFFFIMFDFVANAIGHRHPEFSVIRHRSFVTCDRKKITF